MLTQHHLILASASPRRTELLRQIGVPHTVRPADVLEEAPYPMSSEDYVMYLSQKKARAVAQPGEVILAADTVVSLDHRILEKPADRSAALEMLRLLSGRTHEVVTGVTILTDEREETFTVTTKVRFCTIPESWMLSYVATDEPYDKAGGYGIQGIGGLFVEAIDGDYYNVVGLPINPISRRLDTLGIKPMFA
ncbi:septum formation protein Maf [Exiguobacterium sp. RIT452]|uniref:Maf family protein n=1 Tax=Exiguobacterium sp. RIT452 TaxID=2315552 RepID=UPI000E72CBAC|nr:Maf family protein [Exiguobacterium sp. RIT452]RJP00664.1 septum formation protein Maf [Exiguobacterium sp. RIT452]